MSVLYYYDLVFCGNVLLVFLEKGAGVCTFRGEIVFFLPVRTGALPYEFE